MTAPQPATPGSDVCAICGFSPSCHEGGGEMIHDFRPTAPSEPPAADSPTPGCHGDRDGECSWAQCPQQRDGEPTLTGRHCPLDVRYDDWNDPEPADMARRDAYLAAHPLAAPSPVDTTEPPAETQQGGGLCDDRGPRIGSEGTPRCRRPLGHDGPHRPAEEDGWGMAMSWGNLATATTPAETQQDGREPQPCPRCGQLCTYDGWNHVHPNGFGIGSCAARPSADAETLRRVREFVDGFEARGDGLALSTTDQLWIMSIRKILDGGQ